MRGIRAQVEKDLSALTGSTGGTITHLSGEDAPPAPKHMFMRLCDEMELSHIITTFVSVNVIEMYVLLGKSWLKREGGENSQRRSD